MRFNWSIISGKIYGILKGSCKTVTMYDAKGQETIDPKEATRFFASFESNDKELDNFTILVAGYDQGPKSHINIKTPKLKDDKDFDIVNNIRKHIRKSVGEREGIKINWQVFDRAIDPREEAVNNIKESKKLEELSKDKLKQYTKAAVDDLRYHEFTAGEKGAMGYDRDYEDHTAKGVKRKNGINKAVDKLEELSKGTLKNYIKKSAEDVDINSYESGRKYEKGKYKDAEKYSSKVDNRRKGIDRATDKLQEFDDLSESKDISKTYGSTKSSYQNIGNARLIVRHSARINEEKHGARSRKIRALFVENKDGERFSYPLHATGARAFARHVSNGGTNHDAIAKKLYSLSEDYITLRRSANLLRLTEGENIDQNWISAIRESMDRINRGLKRMHGPKGYAEAATILEDNIVEDTFAINELHSKIIGSIMFEKTEAPMQRVESITEDMMTAARYIIARQNDPKPLNFAWNRLPDLTSNLSEFTKTSDRLKWQLNELASVCVDESTSMRLVNIVKLLNDGIMPGENDLDVMRQAFSFYENAELEIIQEEEIVEEKELNEFLDDFTFEATFNNKEEILDEDSNLILIRKIDDTASGKKVEVLRTADKTRYVVKHFVDGVYQEGCDYDGSDPEEAYQQAGAFLRGEKSLTLKNEADEEMYDDGIEEDRRNDGKAFDYYTFNVDRDGKWNAYGWGTYSRSSVLAGQPRKVWLDSFDTEKEAKAAYPDAQVSSKFTEPQVNLSHLPGDEDSDPYGDNEDAAYDIEEEYPDDDEDEDEEHFDDRDDYDRDDDRIHFADPGGRSSLRAASANNPRDCACPTCGHPNRLTREDKALGYQCNKCADATESGGEIDYYEGPEGTGGDEEVPQGRVARHPFDGMDQFEEDAVAPSASVSPDGNNTPADDEEDEGMPLNESKLLKRLTTLAGI